jgi:hypothetical protein
MLSELFPYQIQNNLVDLESVIQFCFIALIQ